MKPLILALVLATAAPALAQDTTPPPPPEAMPEGRPLMPFMELFTERSEEMMRQFLEDIGPEMEQLMDGLLPELQRLADVLGGFVHYEMPEILPNGDIIIRRKPDAPPLPEDFLKENKPIEL
jgi:hypothetical protein